MFELTRRNLLKFGLAGGALLAAGVPAKALVSVTVTGGDFVPLPIAVPDFASSDPTFGKQIADIVRANLKRSGLFASLDPAAMPTQVGDVNATPDFNAWRGASVDAVVMGQVDRGGQIQSQVRVWDTAKAAQVVGNSYNSDPQNDRRIAHLVSDAIYVALTGGTGYFDSQVVFIAESGPKANRVKQVAIMDQDGANVQVLSSGDQLKIGPVMSLDRSMVAYSMQDDSGFQVYIGQIGGKVHKLINRAPESNAPAFSPNGQTVVFSVISGGITNLYAVDLGGSKPVQLTSGASIDTEASYSPDGSKIAFTSDRGGQRQIYIMSADGGGAQRITYGDGQYDTPVWAPKGDLIAFTRNAGSGFQIGTMKPDGSDERILVDGSAVVESPSFCPNGRVIMYSRDPGGDSMSSLWTVDIWGRNEQQVQIDGGIGASDADWGSLRT